jgi:two-component system cell cycle response regulator
MDMTNLFFGKIGHVYSYSSIILILFLMFIITLQLFLSRRKKAYLSLTVSLAIIMIQYLLLIIYEIKNVSSLETAEYMAQVLHVFAFILINMGIYQLYNASKTREFTYFLTFVFGAILLAGIRYYFVLGEADPSLQYLRLHNIWIEIYLLLLTFLGYYLVSPHIGQQLKYQVALTLYFSTQLARISNHYILDDEKPFLILVENFMPLFFYIILFMMIFNRVVELMQAIYNSSIKDGLTGLFNRPYFFNRVAEYINRNIKLSVIFCDIDNFKKLNDTKGHQTGDKMLKQVATIMMEESENIGLAGRYGGEELVVLVTDTSLRVENVAEQIRRRVEAETIVTVSVGYCKYRKGMTPQELIEFADQAMYQSKKTGKNKVSGFNYHV